MKPKDAVWDKALISPLCCLSRFVFGQGKSSSLSLVDTAGTTSYFHCSSHQPIKVKRHKCEIHAFIINVFKRYLFEKKEVVGLVQLFSGSTCETDDS